MIYTNIFINKMHSLHFDKTAIIQFSCTKFKTRKVLFANISNFRLTATNPWRKCSKTRFARTSTYILSKAAWLTSADSIQNKKHLLVEIGIRRGKGLPTDGWILGWRHFHIYFTPRIEVDSKTRKPFSAWKSSQKLWANEFNWTVFDSDSEMELQRAVWFRA